MVDRISEERRSWNMSRVAGKDTRPELHVRRLLHTMGYRYRLHRKDLPGRPDIVLPKYHAIIFVHGCFWHRHSSCKFAYTPKSRIGFWKKKFEANVNRDKRNQKALSDMNWNILVIWECEIDDSTKLIQRINKFLKSNQGN